MFLLYRQKWRNGSTQWGLIAAYTSNYSYMTIWFSLYRYGCSVGLYHYLCYWLYLDLSYPLFSSFLHQRNDACRHNIICNYLKNIIFDVGCRWESEREEGGANKWVYGQLITQRIVKNGNGQMVDRSGEDLEYTCKDTTYKRLIYSEEDLKITDFPIKSYTNLLRLSKKGVNLYSHNPWLAPL